MKNAPRLARTALVLASLFLSGACVAQSRYTDKEAEKNYWERQYKDLSSFHGQLEAENARLKGELELFKNGGTIEGTAVKGIDERLERLRKLTEAIGTSSGAAPGDVTFVNVEGGYGVRVSDTVLFDSGSTEIKPEGQEILRKVAQQIAGAPYRKVWVRGHTDSVPVKKPDTVQRFPHGNLQLSAARAVEVAALLSANQIDQAKLVVAGFGPAEPVAPNDSEENKRKNRRVEIYVLQEESGLDAR